MERKELLLALIKELFDGNQAAFARAIKKSPAQVNQWLTGHRAIGDGGARHIEMTLNLPGYFDGKCQITGRPSIKEGNPDYNASLGPDTRGLVPVISLVQAGAWHEADDHYMPGDGEEFLPCPASHGMRSYALRVEGDSMTATHGKTYPDGCIIYVDPDQAGGVVSGQRVIAKINGEAKVTFKVFVEESGSRFLKPLNAQYPIITDKFRIIGKVIGKWEPE